jgi:quercetin dioxygenase-like cupin family protein
VLNGYNIAIGEEVIRMVESRDSKDREELKGRVFVAAGLVDYQDGAVVSREVVRGEKGSVTIFSFDEGQGLSEHTAPFDATVFILDGEAEVIIDGDPFLLGAGDMVIMPAGKPHSLNAVKPFKMLLILVRA